MRNRCMNNSRTVADFCVAVNCVVLSRRHIARVSRSLGTLIQPDELCLRENMAVYCVE